VELLLVISIILILAAMGSFVWSTIKNKAKLRIAENDCQHLALCTRGYYDAYGFWPASANWNGDTWYTSYVSSASHVILVDRHLHETLSKLGPGGGHVRDPMFITGSDSSEYNDKGQMCDPWGNPFMVRYDISETNCIPHPFKPGQFLREAVIVWSAGADRLMSTNAPINDAVNADNPRSWSGD
jgi:type II secretory pathway pseudopilin PulG